MNDTLPERFAARMGHLLGPDFPIDIALAVSGGGDSMAMLALAHEWARVFGVNLWVVTVDHGLRDESADEALMVARECAALGHRHETLRWHWDGQGNLQDAARRARLELIDGWRGGIEHVLMAHTQDDVAETFLMRLARGSGVEGLSAMDELRNVQGAAGPFQVIRPLLAETRADLRHHIKTLKVPYVDDPSNEDLRFDRVKARKALASLGIGAGTLAETAKRMGRASEALARRAADVANTCTSEDTWHGVPTGDLLIARDAFSDVERDTQLRVLAAALQWVSSNPYRPRVAPLEGLLEAVLAGGGGTLHGAHVFAERVNIRVAREYDAVKNLLVPVGSLWDNRWLLAAQGPDTYVIRALGADGWQQVLDKPADGPSQRAALALPSIFDGDRLIACAALGFGPTHSVLFQPPAGQFITFLESR